MALHLSSFPLLIFTLIMIPVSEGVRNHSHLSRRHKALISSSLVAASLFFCLLIYFLRLRQNKWKRQTRQLDLESVGQVAKYSYESLERATDTFNSDNIIGSRKTSTVYKGVETSDRGNWIAVKILHLENDLLNPEYLTKLEQFLNADLNVLSRIRHRNLVEVVGSFWPRERFVALVTKYVPNGNLDTAIHRVEKPLDLTKRLNIAVGPD